MRRDDLPGWVSKARVGAFAEPSRPGAWGCRFEEQTVSAARPLVAASRLVGGGRLGDATRYRRGHGRG
jgi:hypothetical protein